MKEYTIHDLARLAGVSTRTLRWYHQIRLLQPSRVGENDYRLYSGAEVDRLQNILFYRALGVELAHAVRVGERPDSPAGVQIAEMHKRWLVLGPTPYDSKCHADLAEMYVADERFRRYYDSEVVGCAQFLRDAVISWLKQGE